MNCQNCNTAISCGCQKRTASDGKEVCSSCIQTYEHNLQIQRQQAAASNSNNTSYNNV